MITKQDLRYVERLAPVAQLLELLGDAFTFDGGQIVRRPEVFESAAQDLWEVFYYLQGRMADEAGHPERREWSESYFEAMAAMARGARP